MPVPSTPISALNSEPAGAVQMLTDGNNNAVTSHPAGTDRLGPIYRALMLSGASVRLLEVTVAEETWRIERVAHTNGGTT
jgi:hypothetical protein